MLDKPIYYNKEKNDLLKEARGVNFKDVIDVLGAGNYFEIIDHHEVARYGNQKILLVEINDYIHCVPFIEEEEYYFFKTVFASRKYNKLLIKKDANKKL